MSDLKNTDVLLTSGRVIRDGMVYGCVCDVANDDEADGCVIDDEPSACVFMKLKSKRMRRSRWGCSEWKRLGRVESVQGAHQHDF